MTLKETLCCLTSAMSAEISCFEAFSAAQRSFTAALRAKDWTALQTAIGLQEDFARAIALKESERVDAFEKLRVQVGCQTSDVYRVALLAGESERRELVRLFRRLRLAATRAKFENASAGEYAAANRDLLRAVLEALFPSKKHRTYGKSGKAIQPELDALLLNTAS